MIKITYDLEEKKCLSIRSKIFVALDPKSCQMNSTFYLSKSNLEKDKLTTLLKILYAIF